MTRRFTVRIAWSGRSICISRCISVSNPSTPPIKQPTSCDNHDLGHSPYHIPLPVDTIVVEEAVDHFHCDGTRHFPPDAECSINLNSDDSGEVRNLGDAEEDPGIAGRVVLNRMDGSNLLMDVEEEILTVVLRMLVLKDLRVVVSLMKSTVLVIVLAVAVEAHIDLTDG